MLNEELRRSLCGEEGDMRHLHREQAACILECNSNTSTESETGDAATAALLFPSD